MGKLIDWTKGNLITLGEGDTAKCTGGLNNGQLYSLFFYNAANNDASTDVIVVGNNSADPITVSVPGTTQNLGLAALCFVSGDDTNSVSASVLQSNPGAQIQAFIGSVKMPVDTSGIRNIQLPFDGNPHAFNAFTRYFAVPESHWYNVQLRSDINQFIVVQFKQKKADVYIVNSMEDPSNVICYAGTTKAQVTVTNVNKQVLSWNIQGNGQQFVWINADSVQDSQQAKITMQSLANLY